MLQIRYLGVFLFRYLIEREKNYAEPHREGIREIQLVIHNKIAKLGTALKKKKIEAHELVIHK